MDIAVGMAALAANVYTHFIVALNLLILWWFRRVVQIELVATCMMLINSLLYHLASFVDPLNTSSYYMRMRSFDLCTAQLLFPMAVTMMPMMDQYVRVAWQLSWILVHVLLHELDFYPMMSVAAAFAVLLIMLVLHYTGAVVLRVYEWYLFYIAAMFTAAGFVFWVIGDGNSYHHALWHVCIFTAFFLLPLSMRVVLVQEVEIALKVHDSYAAIIEDVKDLRRKGQFPIQR